MKFFLLSLLSLNAFAQDLKLSDYNVVIKDISKSNTTKENEFKRMNRKLVKVDDSICSNRAHVWAWDFKMHNIDSAKVFMFYTPKTSRIDGVNWWYHVSPVLNEKGQWWVFDGGYPDRFKAPVQLKDWMKNFNGPQSTCKEIKKEDEDLIERVFAGRSFPETTSHGKYNCYYRIVPSGYWTPNQMAINLLGRNSEGKPMNLQRDEMKVSEVYTACMEASTGPIGRALGASKQKCRAFLRSGTQN